MGTGGVLPTHINQSVYLYNTSGVIEKDKRIYFCPLIYIKNTNASRLVRDVWWDSFELVAQSSSNYKGIQISNWSPQDRSLKIKGNVDDFRVINTQGKAFSYLIMTRSVTEDTEPTVTSNYLYGFFITGATQVGNGTVLLDLEPDDFTNVFYLHNSKTLSEYGLNTYLDVFNEKLVHCHVRKQHYDRYQLVGSELHEINLPIFSQIEESFKYKRQYRTSKKYLNYGDPLTASDISVINTFEWADVPLAEKIKFLKLSTAFLHLTFKDTRINVILTGSTPPPSGSTEYYENKLPNVNVSDNLVKVCMPIYHYIPELDKYKAQLKDAFNTIYGLVYDATTPTIEELLTFTINDISMLLSGNHIYSSYVVSAYISKESSVFNYLTYDIDSNNRGKVCVKVFNSRRDSYLDFLCFPYFHSISPQTQANLLSALHDGTIWVDYTKHEDEPNAFMLRDTNSPKYLEHDDYFFMAVEPEEKITFQLPIHEEVFSTGAITGSNYNDPVLTFNPYTFYSVSYLGKIEVPLNKLNYYEDYNITCELNVNVSDSFKYSFVPTYTINGKRFKYYTESLEVTLTNNLTICNDKIFDYLIANISQMKNQYAVNDLNHEYGLVTTGVSGVGNIAGNAVKGGLIGGAPLAGAGAIGGTVQTITSLINEGISWDKDTKEISMNQKAKLADMGNLPSNLKQVGTDISLDLSLNELGLYLNHYTIDDVSRISICKYLERFGYMVNLFDILQVNSRVGWNYIELNSMDVYDSINTEQEESIRQIFLNGVTLLHDPDLLHSQNGRNIETAIQNS